MNRGAVITFGALVLVAAAGAVYLLSDSTGATVEAVELPAEEVEQIDVPTLPAPIEAPTWPAGEARPLEVASEAPPAEIALTVEPALTLHVLHAGGEPGSGGRVALYDDRQALLGEGALDTAGDWTHPGVDVAVEVFVLGIPGQPARFTLETGRGDHVLTLPDGAWLAGRVLLNRAPPGVPFPLTLGGPRPLLTTHDSAPASADIPGDLTSAVRGGFFTDADGYFRISGLEAGTEVSLRWPRFHAHDPSYSSPFPVVVPASGIVLALVRPAMIRGRVLREDGSPADDARLSFKLTFRRDAESGASSSSLTYQDSAVQPDGRFAMSIGSPFLPRVDELGVPEAQAPVIRMSVDLTALTPDGSRASATLADEVVTRNHDLGDLILQPAQRVVLALVDLQGRPVTAADVRPETDGKTAATLQSDDAGQVTIDLAVASAGFATVVAPGFRTELVELPTHAPEGPLEVLLTPANTVSIRLLGPWDNVQPLEEGWRFTIFVAAQDSAYHDGLLTPMPSDGRASGPDDLRGPPEAYAGSAEFNTYNDGSIRRGWTVSIPRFLFEGLRSNHPLTFSARISEAPESFGVPPDGIAWESEEIWLTDGEQRQLTADLRHLLPEG